MARAKRGRGAAWWMALAGALAALLGIILLLFLLTRLRPERAGVETTLTAADAGTGAAGPPCEAHATCAAGALCTRGRCAPITPETTECRSALIRFARGATELSASAEGEIERAARCALTRHDMRLAIEPSIDAARSPRENEDLTKARQSAVRRALERRGVSPERLRAMGFRDVRP
ncbi:MAG: OmpA family protein [Labilithrix sp.]|nr:OmpA family protein [Labilithrix sp.]